MVEDVEAQTRAWMEEKGVPELFEMMTARLLYERPEVCAEAAAQRGKAGAALGRPSGARFLCCVARPPGSDTGDERPTRPT